MIDTKLFKNNLDLIGNRVKIACSAAGRACTDVSILAVSKKQTSDAIRIAYACGVRDFGENYVQELVEKQKQLADLTDIRWHFIGHLQSNKVKFVANCFAIHSVDSLEVAKKLALLQHDSAVAKIQLYVQLQIDPTDKNKFGAENKTAENICAYLATESQVEWVGFMGMGPANAGVQALALLYQKFYADGTTLWRKQTRKSEPKFSLGMSGDLEVAIAAGSNMIRVGTALFGER